MLDLQQTLGLKQSSCFYSVGIPVEIRSATWFIFKHENRIKKLKTEER